MQSQPKEHVSIILARVGASVLRADESADATAQLGHALIAISDLADVVERLYGRIVELEREVQALRSE